MHSALTALIRSELLHADGVRKLPPVRRLASLVKSETTPDSLFFLESGYVKVMRRGEQGKEVILSIVGPGEIFAEHVLLEGVSRPFTAEILLEGTIYEIPRAAFFALARAHPHVWQWLWEVALQRNLDAEQKIALLCLNDVEFRLLYYLTKLAPIFTPAAHGREEYSLPFSQSEIACLIGATRETTSSTLNQLSREGLLRLSRRLVIVPSLDAIRNACRSYAAKAAKSGG